MICWYNHFVYYTKTVATTHHFDTIFHFPCYISASSLWSSFFLCCVIIYHKPVSPQKPLKLCLTWLHFKRRDHAGGHGGVGGLGRPRQVAGSPASEPAVGLHPPRGAKLPARLPQPHFGPDNVAALRVQPQFTLPSAWHSTVLTISLLIGCRAFCLKSIRTKLCTTTGLKSSRCKHPTNQTVSCSNWLFHWVFL